MNDDAVCRAAPGFAGSAKQLFGLQQLAQYYVTQLT